MVRNEFKFKDFRFLFSVRFKYFTGKKRVVSVSQVRTKRFVSCQPSDSDSLCYQRSCDYTDESCDELSDALRPPDNMALPSHVTDVTVYVIARFPDNRNPMLPIALQNRLGKLKCTRLGTLISMFCPPYYFYILTEYIVH